MSKNAKILISSILAVAILATIDNQLSQSSKVKELEFENKMLKQSNKQRKCQCETLENVEVVEFKSGKLVKTGTCQYPYEIK